MARPSANKLELLKKLMREKGMGDGPSSGIPRRTGGGDAPLSFSQRRLWFLDQLEPGTSLYNDELTLRVSGGVLDEERFEICLGQVVQRHEVLRTTFHDVGGEPVQRVHPGNPVSLERIDLRVQPEPARTAECARILRDRVREPYRLDQLPLARAVLIRLGDERYEFGLTMHHIVSDGVSYGVVYKEMGLLYAAGRPGSASPPAPLPIQFADYAAWERETITEETIQGKLGFWREYLADTPPLLELPFAKPRIGHRTHRGAFHRFSFPTPRYEALQAFCRDAQVTSNWVLLAGYFATLHLFTAQTDLCIGVSSSSRTRTELEPLIGFFVQTLLVRSDLADNPTFEELIRRTRARALEVSKHEDVPFDRVARELRRPGRSIDVPLIQVWFGHMRDIIPPMELPGLDTSYEIVDPGNARFDLCLILDEARGGLDCYFEYDVDLLPAETVARFAALYMDLLSLVLEHPRTRLDLLRETFPSPHAPPRADEPESEAPRPPAKSLKKLKKVRRRTLEG